MTLDYVKAIRSLSPAPCRLKEMNGNLWSITEPQSQNSHTQEGCILSWPQALPGHKKKPQREAISWASEEDVCCIAVCDPQELGKSQVGWKVLAQAGAVYTTGRSQETCRCLEDYMVLSHKWKCSRACQRIQCPSTSLATLYLVKPCRQNISLAHRFVLSAFLSHGSQTRSFVLFTQNMYLHRIM